MEVSGQSGSNWPLRFWPKDIRRVKEIFTAGKMLTDHNFIIEAYFKRSKLYSLGQSALLDDIFEYNPVTNN